MSADERERALTALVESALAARTQEQAARLAEFERRRADHAALQRLPSPPENLERDS
jgi:hypothetical protein